MRTVVARPLFIIPVRHREAIVPPFLLAPCLAFAADDLAKLETGTAVAEMAGPFETFGLIMPAAPVPSPVPVPIGGCREDGHQEKGC